MAAPGEIQTEVFFFPAAAHTEKDGSFTNTQRLLQWHHQAVEPPGDCRSELDFLYHLGRRLKALYRGSTDPKDRPLQHLAWDYPVKGRIEEPDAEAVLKEINGCTVADGRLVPGFTALKDDGSTACGCWIYRGCLQGRREPDGAPKAGRGTTLGGSRVGLGMAARTGGSFTTAPRPTRRAGRGRSARSTSGGMRRRANGRASTCRTSSRGARPPTAPARMPRVPPQSPELIPSS